MLRRLLTDAIPAGLADLYVRAKGILVLPFLAHQLGTAEYGAWSQVQVFVAMVSPLLFLGTEGAIIRLAAGKDAQGRLACLSAWLVFLAGSAGLVILLVSATAPSLEALLFRTDGRYLGLVFLALGNLVALAFLNAARSWYYLELQPRAVAGLSAVQTTLGIAAVFATVAMDGGIVTFLALNLLADLLTAVLVIRRFFMDYRWAPPDFGFVGPALRFGLPLVPAGLATWGLNMLDRLILADYRGIAEVGTYSFAYTLAVTAVALLVRPFRLLYPALIARLHAEGRHEEVQQAFDHSAGAVLAVTIPAIVGAHAVADLVIGLLAPPGFLGGAPLTSVIMGAYVLMILSSYFENHLGLVHRQYWFTISTGAALACNLSMNLWLIPTHGMWGAAIATLGAFLLQCLISFAAAARAYPVRIRPGMPLRILAASAAMGAVLWLLRDLLEGAGLHAGWRLAILVPAGASVYGLAAVLAGVMPAARIRSWLHGRRRRAL
ncbi:MAG: lipopolysaccharide biosynthesis protein [Rhodocyclaceae bacterium]|nr:lipopolysaccharide biosynthesis protein [Rhodocyclaceae bacterium]